MKRILLTAFEPFGGETLNPALETMKRVRAPEGVELIRLEVPTGFRLSSETVLPAIEKTKPDAIVCLGQAGGRSAITPERVAINIDDASISDNYGEKPCDRVIEPDGENAYFSTLPVKEIAYALKAAGIRSEVSNTAGTFVCNHLMYCVLHYVSENGLNIPAGFIHVPFIPEQTAGKTPAPPSMPLETIAEGIGLALQVISDV